MIDVTQSGSLIVRQHFSNDTRKDTDPAPFAKSLEAASKNANSRREITGRTADNPVKRQDQKEWTRQRSKTDNKEKTESKVQNDTPDVDNPDQDQSFSAEYNLLMWFFNIPEELNDAEALVPDENTMISEETMKNILLWIQSIPEIDSLPAELTAIIDKLQEMLKAQSDLSQITLSVDENTGLTELLAQMKSIIDSMFEDVTPKENAQQEAVVPLIAEEVAFKNKVTVTDGKYEATKQSEVEILSGINTGNETTTVDLTTNLTDHHLSKESFNSTETSAELTAQEQSNETLIPFSLAQIDTLLQQNTVINALDQQQTQVQQEVLQQVIDKIQVAHGANQSFVTLHLVPEHLGKLTIQLTSDLQQGMTARIYAETPHAKEMIESNFGQLKDALSGKGVNLTAMEVFVGQDPESSEKQREFQYQQAKAQRRRGARMANGPNTERTALISEIPVTRNPYVLTEGFDQLG